MSASPANLPSGPASVTPTAGNAPAPTMRKKAPPSIFNPKKKPLKPRTQIAPQPQPSKTPATAAKASTSNAAAASAKDEGNYADYPIYIERRPAERDARFHTLKIHSRSASGGGYVPIDPYDSNMFTRPVHLFRRNANDRIETPDLSDGASGLDDKEREMMQAKRAERQAEREANQALIAPSGNDAKPAGGRRKKPQKKVEERIEHPKSLLRNQMLKEEARPWHLEDFEGKNKWVASYEAPMSKAHAMLEIGQDNNFRLIPLEKYYSMKAVSKLDKKLDSDTIEKQMQQKYAPSRWWRGTQAENLEARKQAALSARAAARAKDRGSDDEEEEAVNRDEYQADVDEIDFEYKDEFQDDDEGFVFGDPGDDDAKEAEQKVRDEQRTANLPGTGFRDEDRDWDAEEDKGKQLEREERKKQKRMRRQLQKKERQHQYESDSDEDMFGSESESEDSEEERERLEKEEKEKEEEARKAAQQNGDKSGTSTKGTNTPTGRTEKKAGTSLKREADVSELSGNESSRKRAKLNGRGSSNLPNGARSLSPDSAKRPSGYGSGSDTDASRAGRVKDGSKLKGRPINRSRSGTPAGSRDQSPQRPNSTGPTAGGPSSPPRAFPTKEEILASIPADGILYSLLAKQYRGRVKKDQTSAFVAIVKEVTRYDKSTGTMYPLNAPKS